MWRQWLQQVEGLVMLPDTEAEPSDAWTKQERLTSHRACVVERRIHSSPTKRQHMFMVRNPPLSSIAFQNLCQSTLQKPKYIWSSRSFLRYSSRPCKHM